MSLEYRTTNPINTPIPLPRHWIEQAPDGTRFFAITWRNIYTIKEIAPGQHLIANKTDGVITNIVRYCVFDAAEALCCFHQKTGKWSLNDFGINRDSNEDDLYRLPTMPITE